MMNTRLKENPIPKCSDLAQSSVLSPQSASLTPDNFEKICTELLREGHAVKFCAPGDSMYPTICDGDIITVAPIKTTAISTGDILLYRHKSGVAAHRVIRIIPKSTHHAKHSALKTRSSDLSPQHCFILRGDAAIVIDEPVTVDQILGKVIAVEKDSQGIDPYSLKAKICFKARRIAARLKRSILFQT